MRKDVPHHNLLEKHKPNSLGRRKIRCYMSRDLVGSLDNYAW